MKKNIKASVLLSIITVFMSCGTLSGVSIPTPEPAVKNIETETDE